MGSIKDRVAVIGVGCTKFGEQWRRTPKTCGEAVTKLLTMRVTPQDIEACWVGVL
jgi:hypothetical protein